MKIKHLLFLIIIPFLTTAQEILKDITLSNASSHPIHMVNAGSKTFFLANSGNGLQLWVSNGTSQGTIPLSNPTVSGQNNPLFYNVTNQKTSDVIIASGEKVYFKAQRIAPPNFSGEELWVSDGTSQGTKLLRDIGLGGRDAYIEKFIHFNDKIVFLASSNGDSQYKELFITDGSEFGTRRIHEISRYHNEFGDPSNWLTIGNNLFFTVKTLQEGNELWITDGTYSGTQIVKDISSGSTSSNPYLLQIINNKLIFTVKNSTNSEYSLMVTDGTSGGTLTLANNILDADLQTGVLNNKLYFQRSTGYQNIELWVSDGTPNGTALFQDINTNGSSNPGGFHVYNNLLYFSATDSQGQNLLWKTDGTQVGTQKVQISGVASKAVSPLRYISATQAVNLDSHFYFEANSTSPDSTELWKSNGSSSGTQKVKTLKKNSKPLILNQSSVFGNSFYFEEFDDSQKRNMLWISDGTTDGTKKIETVDSDLFRPVPLQVAQNDLYLTGYKDNIGYELFKHDGTVLSLMKDINLTVHSDLLNLSLFDTLNNQLFFIYNNNKNGLELWRTDSTQSVTTLFHEFTYANEKNSGFAKSAWSNSTNFSQIMHFKGKIYIVANQILYVTDGLSTPQAVTDITGYYNIKLTKANDKLFIIDNTKLWVIDENHSVSSINPDVTWLSHLNDIPIYGSIENLLIFAADTPEKGFELWKSDGTAVGTTILKDINPGVHGSSFSESYASCNNHVYFTIYDNGIAPSLWVTDGTETGTKQLKELREIRNMTCFNNEKVVFSAYTYDHGYELWESDGSSIGTKMIADLSPGSESSFPRMITSRSVNSPFPILNNELFFAASPTNNHSIYKYNGQNVSLVKAGLEAREMVVHNDKIFFNGGSINSPFGEELWETNGLAEGTKIVKDISPGSNSSSPFNLISFNGSLLFMANHPTHGQEIWIINKKCPELLTLTTEVSSETTFKASRVINGKENNLIQSTGKVIYQSGENVLLEPGFETKPGSVFTALISGCKNSSSN